MRELKLAEFGRQHIEFPEKDPEKVALGELYTYNNKKPRYYLILIGGMPVRLYDRIDEVERKHDVDETGYKVYANEKTVDYYVDLIGAI